MRIEILIYLQSPSWVTDGRIKWKKIGSKEGRKLETVDHEVLSVPLRCKIFLKPSLANLDASTSVTLISNETKFLLTI